MAVNMNPLSKAVSDWVAGGDGKVRGFDPAGLLGGGLEYTIADHTTTVLWVEDGAAGGGTGTELSPYQNIRQAIDALTDNQGAMIKVKNGTINVTSANYLDWMINDRAGDGFAALKSGTGWATSHVNRNNMITITAETPYGVRMSYTGAGGYYRAFVHLENAQYVSVDGFIFEYDETSGNALLNGVSAYNNNYISRCIVKRAADGNNGSWFSCGDNSLIEMCAGVGGTRYGFRSGSATAATTNHCFRLCVGRQDFSDWAVPNATFAHYGNNTGSGSGRATFLNCIALDGQEDPAQSGDPSRWGSFYAPKDADDVNIHGFISLNETAFYASIHAGEQSGSNMTAEDCVMWDGNGDATQAGFRFNGNGTGNTATRLTIGDIIGNDLYASNTITPTNYRAADTLNGTDPSILYQSDGADARYVYGSLGQRFGDTGYNTKTANPAFPFPYEDTIKTVFTEQLTTPVGFSPSNTSNRGFCLSTSLTDYIIKYVNGTTTLAEVYP